MATYHEKKNLWEARRRVTLPDGTRSRPSFWSETAEEAENLADQYIKSLEPPKQGLDFDTYASFHYAPTIKRKSENWRSQVVWATKYWLSPKWGRRPIDQIKRSEVQAWFSSLEEMSDDNGKRLLSAWSIIHIRKVFHAVMDLAVFDQIITKNPIHKITVASPNHEPTIWTPRQLARLILCNKGKVWQPAIFLGGVLGTRIGESLALQTSELTPDQVGIDWQLLKEKLGPKKWEIKRVDRLKTPGSHRRIPLPEGFYSMLMGFADLKSGKVCPNFLGGWLDPENASRGITEAIARANASITAEDEESGLKPLPRGTSHDLRHTCKAILEDMGCPAMARRMILGHAGKDAHEKYGGAYDATIRKHLSEIISVIEAEDRLLSLRPKMGVKDLQNEPERATK